MEFGPAITLHFVQLVIARACLEDLAGDATEGEFARALLLKGEIGGLQHVRIVLGVIRHRHNAPFAQETHAEAANSILTRTKKSFAVKEWAKKIAKRRGLKKARVALARRLAVIMHAMLRDGTLFQA